MLNPINDGRLRELLRHFAGVDRYSKFVRAINRACRVKNRLVFWQEQLWADFAAATPDVPRTNSEIIAAFSVCDVHDCPLQSPPDDRPAAEIRSTPEYDQASDSSFPFAINSQLVCLSCRAEREKWIAANAELCRILRRQTTYEECSNRWLGVMTEQPALKEMIESRAAYIAEKMLPGDELWEWDAGGWHRFAGIAGVAIVRNGIMVTQWNEWRS